MRAAQPGPHGLQVVFDTKGQMLEVRAKRTSGISLQPYLVLIDPTGEREATGTTQNGGGVVLDRQLASSGAYTLIVQASSGSGPYSVTLTLR